MRQRGCCTVWFQRGRSHGAEGRMPPGAVRLGRQLGNPRDTSPPLCLMFPEPTGQEGGYGAVRSSLFE